MPALKTHFNESSLSALFSIVSKGDMKNVSVSGMLLMCELEFDEIRFKKFASKVKPFVFSDFI